jgi:hypothetical protein
VIYSDFERGFIAAEMVLTTCVVRPFAKARRPEMRIEGKDYVVKDVTWSMFRIPTEGGRPSQGDASSGIRCVNPPHCSRSRFPAAFTRTVAVVTFI